MLEKFFYGQTTKWGISRGPRLVRDFDEFTQISLKEHGNEADFLGVLQKLVPQRSLTVPFEPFRFWLRIRWDIHNQKTTPRLSDTTNRGVDNSPTRRVGESAVECLKENLASRRVGDSPTRQVRKSLTPRLSKLESRLLSIQIFKIYHRFPNLNG